MKQKGISKNESVRLIIIHPTICLFIPLFTPSLTIPLLNSIYSHLFSHLYFYFYNYLITHLLHLFSYPLVALVPQYTQDLNQPLLSLFFKKQNGRKEVKTP